MRLHDEQIERYSRQLILAEVGPRGQEKLGAARVAVVGTDVAAERVVAYLAAAGVGTLGLVEFDVVVHGDAVVDDGEPRVALLAAVGIERRCREPDVVGLPDLCCGADVGIGRAFAVEGGAAVARRRPPD